MTAACSIAVAQQAAPDASQGKPSSTTPPPKTKPSATAHPVHVLFVGRLERYKGLYLLLDALRDVPDVRLTVVGDGSYRQELERLAAGLNVHAGEITHDAVARSLGMKARPAAVAAIR